MTAPPATTAPAKIVVADDDQTLLHTLVWILRSDGFDVVPIPGGENLLQRLDVESPDLLMLDIMMPRVDGLQLLERVKQDPRWRDLPVLMISSMPPEEATVRSLGLGAADFISKPFRVRELVARVRAHLQAGRALQAARMEAAEQAQQARRHAEESSARLEMVDILHEVTDSLKPDEIYHILARRVARVLEISKCSMVIAQPGDQVGLVVAAYENPMLRNLEIRLDRYPEIRKALATQRTVLIADVQTDPLYAEVRAEWQRDGISVPTRSVIAVPFTLRATQAGVFFLRTTGDAPALTDADASFAESVISAAVNAIDKAYDFESAVSDREHFQELARTDALTGCLNRRALHERLEREMERVRRYAFELTILMLDLDRFKTINDTRGHLAGDSVLRQIGEVLQREVRSVDIVARYGGEEFVVVLPDTALEGGMVFAERLRARVAEHDFAEGGEPLHVTVSVGVAAFPAEGLKVAEDVIAQADSALYRAKHEGRNMVRR